MTSSCTYSCFATMDSANSVPATNIVAAAMSTANLKVSADLPKFSKKVEASSSATVYSTPSSPQRVQSQNCDPPNKAERMDVSAPTSLARVQTKQESKENDAMPQPLAANSNQATPSTNLPRSEDGTKNFDPRNLLKANGAHVVTSESYSMPTMNGGDKMHLLPPRSTEENLINVAMEASPTSSSHPTTTAASEIIRTKPIEDTTYPITCGLNKAELVWKKFICPGINAKCVKCGENWFTPKEFVSYAGKSTLKDWKRAIRINGIMLRRLIENGELNYYEHETNCSNQCRSNKNSSSFDCDMKNYGSLDSDVNSREHSLDNPLPRSSSDDQPHFSKKPSLSSSLYVMRSHDNSSSLTAANSFERSSSEDSGMAASPLLDGRIMRETPITVEKLQELERFWNAVARLDFFDEVICDVVSNIKNIHSRSKIAGSMNAEDIIVLTNLVNCLEMFPDIVQRMSAHKHKVEKETEASSHTIQELEKKLAEQKKYDLDLKRKSRQLDSVMILTPNEKRQKRNIIRIGRQKAVESRVPLSTGTGSSSQTQAEMRENVMLAAATRAGINQGRDMWPVDPLRASQMAAHLNSTSSAQTVMPAVLSQFSLFPAMRTSADALASSSLHQAFVSSTHGSRESTQSPKKQ